MASPRTGILILVLLASVSLAGGLLGWKLRQPPLPAAGGVSVSATGATDDLSQALCDPMAFHSLSVVRNFACYREMLDNPGHEISLAAVRTASSMACAPLPAI